MAYQREYDRRLRVGLVGAGSHAYRNVLPALHHLPVILSGICDLDRRLAEHTAAEYGVPAFSSAAEMYAAVDLDGVLVCAGPRQHPDLAVEALSAGLHVWMEKPPGLFAADVEKIMAARGDLVCAVGFKKAYQPAVRKAKELMALPEFGALRSVLAVYPMTMPADGAGVLSRRETTNWLNNGCHPISLMVEVAGDVESVRTVVGPGDAAVGSVTLTFAGGAVGTFFLAGGAPHGYPIERYDLIGEGRSITIDNSARVSFHRGIPFDYARQTDFTGPGTDTGSVVWEAEHRLATLENSGLFVQGMFFELSDFCGAILDHRPLRSGDLPFALQVMRVYEAGLRSTGDVVPVG